jgi:hypothetical protein
LVLKGKAMKFTFSPLRHDTPLRLHRVGDVLTLNGEAFDFAPLPEGALLPAEAIESEWFAGPVERVDGELQVLLFLPHGPCAPEATRFPVPLTVTEDGPVPLPPHDLPETE